jgi:DNA-binding XRE family transcriptional regulator
MTHPNVYTQAHKNRFNAGLNYLYAMARPGECVSRTEIAAACGVSRQAIHQIEQRALMKLRKKLKDVQKMSIQDL